MREHAARGAVPSDGEPLPSLFALAGGKGAVHLGTFSKTVATGLRVGWTIADMPVVEALRRTRFGLRPSPGVQRTWLELAADGRFERPVQQVWELYRRKRDVMLAAL